MVVRSLTTVCNVVLTYLFFFEKTSTKALGCCGIIILGFVLGIDQENGLGTLSFSGVFYGIMASFFVALNAIYTKKSLNAVDNNIWKLTIYNNFNACFIFLPLIFIFGEHTEILSFHHAFSLNTIGYFWFAMTISGCLGFSMSYVTSLQIQVTSPLTHNVSGTAKAYAQTLIGVMYYNEVKTMLWWFSNCLVLIGAALYSQVRRSEMSAKSKSENTLPVSSTFSLKSESGINIDEDATDKNALLISGNAKN
jgi:GDP-fucose transporter C1